MSVSINLENQNHANRTRAKRRGALRVAAISAAVALAGGATGNAAHAADGTWTNLTSGGLWSAGSNWSGGNVADGQDGTADFSTLDITADNTVHLDSARTIGKLIFGDTVASNNWILDNNGVSADTLTLSLSSTAAPTITVTSQTATISANLLGTAGFTKAGAGTLALAGTNTYSGTTAISAGTLEFQAAPAMSSTSALTFSSGATLSLRADANTTFTPASFTGSAGSYTIAVNQLSGAGAGKTLTLAGTYNTGAAGSNLTVNSTSGDTLVLSSQLAFGGSSSTINLSGADMTLNAGATYNGVANGPLLTVNANSNTLLINGNYTTGNNRWAGIQVNNGALTLANAQNGGGSTNNGLYAILNGGTLNLNNANAIGGAAAGNKLTLTSGTLDNTSGSAKTLAKNPAVTIGGDFAFSTSGSTSANDLNLGTGAVSLGATAGPTRTITTNGAATLTLGGVISNGTNASPANSITKAGAGTLVLSGASAYTGATTVTGGKLLVSGAGAINSSSGITINGSGAKFVQTSSVASTPAITLTQGTFDGTGSIGAVIVGDGTGGTITHGNGGTGALTLSSLTFNGVGTANINYGSAAGIAVTGALTTANTGAGEVTVNAANNTGWTNGSTYNLITFGSLTGGSADFSKGTVSGLTGRQSATIGAAASAVTLTIAGDSPVWTGASGGQWVQFAANSPTSASPNFALKTGHSATDFWVSDVAEFNDTYNLGAGSVPVTQTTATIHGGNVSPTTVTFNNSAVNYTITSDDGSGIAAGTVVKNGSGTATIAESNSYTGGTTINAGTLALSGAGTLGPATGAVTLNGGTLDLGGTSQTLGAVTLAAPATIQNGTVTGASIVGSNGSGNATVSANLAGATSVAMTGAGTLVLSGTNTNSGATTVSAGTIEFDGSPAMSATSAVSLPNGSNVALRSDTSATFTPASATMGGVASAAGISVDRVGGSNTGNTLSLSKLDFPSAGQLNVTSANGYLLGLNAVTIENNGTANNPITTFNLAGGASLQVGTITANGTYDTVNFSGAGTTSVSGNITQLAANRSAALTFNQSGTVTISGNNNLRNNNNASDDSNTFVNVISGTTNFNSANAIFTSGLNTGTGFSLAFNLNGGAIDNTSGGALTLAGIHSTNINADFTFVGTNDLNLGAGATTLGGSGTTRTITTNGLATLTVAGAIANGATANSLTKAGSGNLVLTGASTYSGNTTVNGGTLNINASTVSPNYSIAPTATLNVNGTLPAAANVTVGGTANFAGNTSTAATTRTLGALTINAGGLAAIKPSSFAFTPAILRPATLVFNDPTATLDLSNNELIAPGAASDALTLIQAGQITTSVTPDLSKAIGYISLSGADAGNFEARYTIKGDATLDGKVDVGDLGALATSYGITGGMSWANGDFNRDGNVNVGDLGALATNYGTQLASGPSFDSSAAAAASPLAVVATSAAVPEPTSLGLLGIAAFTLAAGRRQRRRQ